MSLLRVEDLSITYAAVGLAGQDVVRHATFALEPGEFVGLVGESGSGKTTLGYAVTRLLRAPGRISGGSIRFDGVDVATLSASEVRVQRQGGFAMVLQSGMNALNPVRSVGHHFSDVFAAHGHVGRRSAQGRVRQLLAKVELPSDVIPRFPGELSGGMRQRVSIALALALEPQLMVFDEPTTALDVLVQRAVMDTIRELQATEGFTALLISHDLGVVLEATQRVLVMHDGEIVEDAGAQAILAAPATDYTRMLLSHYADPRAEHVQVPGLVARGAQPDPAEPSAMGEKALRGGSAAAREPIVLTDVSKVYRAPNRSSSAVTAVDNVSFTLHPGASVALVGASGSGKSTIAKLITGVERPSQGSVLIGARNIGTMRRRDVRRLYREVQMVFQDPYAALNPVHTIEYALTRPVLNHSQRAGQQVRHRVRELLEIVGLTPVDTFLAKLPHQLSGGQRQRVVIARALASEPQVIIADEPVSMLDVSLRAGVLALLEDLRSTLGVSLLYITHDLLSARLITDHIIVLNKGIVVEAGDTVQVLQHPRDDYTAQLLAALPVPTRGQPGMQP